jgi:uroporphyrinogen decarboxylase
MTNRRRIVDTLLCRPVDRPPLCRWLGFMPWDETLVRWKEETGIQDLDPCAYFDLDPFFECAPLEMGPVPHFDPVVVRQDDEFIVSIDYRGITTRNRRDGASMPEWIDHPVKNPDQWRQYKSRRLLGPIGERTAGLDRWCAESAGRDVPIQVGCYPWGVFGTMRDILGTEGCLLAFYDHPEMARDIIETNVGLWLALFEKVAVRVAIDHIHIWEDMSGKQGSMISPAMLEEFMMPAYDRIAAFARAHGVPILSVDTDGQVAVLLPAMMAHGVNGFMPFEVQAGNDVQRYRDEYPGLGIMGGLDKSALSKSKKDIHRELDRARLMFERGGWIAGFDHLIPPDVPWQNYKYALTELRRMAG